MNKLNRLKLELKHYSNKLKGEKVMRDIKAMIFNLNYINKNTP